MNRLRQIDFFSRIEFHSFSSTSIFPASRSDFVLFIGRKRKRRRRRGKGRKRGRGRGRGRPSPPSPAPTSGTWLSLLLLLPSSFALPASSTVFHHLSSSPFFNTLRNFWYFPLFLLLPPLPLSPRIYIFSIFISSLLSASSPFSPFFSNITPFSPPLMNLW